MKDDGGLDLGSRQWVSDGLERYSERLSRAIPFVHGLLTDSDQT